MLSPTVMLNLIILSILCFRVGDSAEEYGVLSRSEILSKISFALEVEEVSGALMSVEDFRWLWKRLMFRDCAKERKGTDCNLCMKAEDFLNWYNHKDAISEEQFIKYSVGIIYILTEVGETKILCEDYTSKLLATPHTDVAEELLNEYGERGLSVVPKTVKSMLQDIGRNCECLSSGQCFPASEDIPPPNGYVGIGVEYTSLYVIMKLLDSKCHPYQPTKYESTVDNIVKNFQKVYSNALLKGLNQTTKCHTKSELTTTLSSDPRKPMLSRRTVSDMTSGLMEWMRNITMESRTEQKSGGKGRKGPRKSTWQTWIASFFSIAVISFGSLIGIVLFRGQQGKYFNHVMCFLVSMGSSVLICDALLHLIPHSLHFHGHIDGRHFNSDSWLWKCLMILIGIYLFIIMELTLSVLGFDHGHSHGEPSDHNGDAYENHNMQVIKSSNDEKAAEVSLMERRSSKGKSKEKFTIRSIKSVAWMILVGDGVHNFMDGVAIGGVFAEPFPRGLNGGIMSSIAIFIHEVPHELGDFAVLISSGLSIKWALILNLLSSLTAFVGGIVGIILGTHWNASSWIFALTGGLFIYISLVDMLPEVRRNPLLKTSPKLALFLDCCGLIFGLVIMFFLAAYENKLENALT